MEKLNNYPVILVHGFSGFGEDEAITKLFPYYGMWNGNVNKIYKKLGTECYTPSIGAFSSAWDRACELYAHIVGGRVDYGKVHSEKNNHKRFGKTYKALVPNWGKLDGYGKIHKINLIGHSFGGPTVRLFIELLINGSEEERIGTSESLLSDLFKGGREKWVHSVTTLASANDGISLLYAIEKYAPAVSKSLLKVGSALGSTPFRKIYDFGLDQFDITREYEKKIEFKVNEKEIDNYLSSEDCVLNDLYIHTARERMKDFKTNDSIYYFTYAGCRTKKKRSGKQVPKSGMFFMLKPVSYIIGSYKNDKPDKSHTYVSTEWQPNDGMVNTITAIAPKNERQEDFTCNKDCKPGVWYGMPIEEKDHMSYMGIGEKPDAYWNFFYDILYRICNLETVE
ncbi:MAG: hypothetical protein RR012_01030 [Oscillospiraceae bacterium]